MLTESAVQPTYPVCSEGVECAVAALSVYVGLNICERAALTAHSTPPTHTRRPDAHSTPPTHTRRRQRTLDAADAHSDNLGDPAYPQSSLRGGDGTPNDQARATASRC
ncbi:hypothetical protein I546_5767 [Mycobacterium kansasii 732]|nr:hypothetical protein I546_5767 [Mycobacterium kansasii 732]